MLHQLEYIQENKRYQKKSTIVENLMPSKIYSTFMRRKFNHAKHRTAVVLLILNPFVAISSYLTE